MTTLLPLIEEGRPSDLDSHTTGFTQSPNTAYTPQWHSVEVGRHSRGQFAPPSIIAAAGDLVKFVFVGNYSLIQSTLENPCRANSNFESAFGLQSINYMVQSTAAEYFFSMLAEVQNVCNNGTVFSINPGGTNDTFLKNAG
jgi:hypothetical protein